MQNFNLINADCMLAMKDIEDKSVDLILCDLPYGQTANKDDVQLPMKEMWAEYKRIIKDHGCIVLYAQGLFYVDLISANRKMFRYDYAWNKILTTGFLNAKRMPLRQHEQVAVFYKRLPTYNPQFHEGIPLHSMGKAYKDKPQTNNNYGDFSHADDSRSGTTQKYPTSVLTVQKPHPSVAKHRTEKPMELAEFFIKTYTNEGDVVLDNCMGAGNVGAACVKLDRRFIGIEKDNRIFQQAVKNIAEASILV